VAVKTVVTIVAALNTLAVALLLSTCVFAQQPAPVLQGTWAASAGAKQAFRGTWSAQPLPGRPNAVIGAWTILDAANRVVREGTWSAEKSAQGWQGAWSARAMTGRSAAGDATLGAPVSGTWQTDAADLNVRTLTELLQKTVEREIAGTWRRGQAAGHWRLNDLSRQ
jgi:hypothetical protein